MQLEKNQDIELYIEDMTTDGEGVGKLDGFPLFVKDTVIGDKAIVKVIKLKKNYGYGRLMSIIEPSKDRVAPKCPIARQCGGCQIQELAYNKQLEFKANMVKNNIERIGGITEYEMEPIIGMEEPFYYRNKAQFPVGTDKNGNIVIGFYAGRTHCIIENDVCYIGSKRNADIVAAVKKYMLDNNVSAYNEADNKGLVRHILIREGINTEQLMVCLIINGKKLPNEEAFVKALQATGKIDSIMLNYNTQNTNVILGEEVRLLYGTPYIEDYIGDIKYRISPLSFFQVNPKQTYKLYSKALEYADLTGNEVVWDLYCGIGTISLFMAPHVKKVYGVEIVPPAIKDAKENAKLNNITNAEFFVGASEEVLPAYYNKHKDEYADVIVVDPPRKGCDEKLLDTIVKMAPKKVVYVSCDSATMARDIKYLSENGYKLEKVCPVDQFPHTCHVESVAVMHQQDLMM
ncbi:MAG: 23S rRNA (uracil(1939)-C(5))-methyltransferase RlmD [Lachnospira sp.]|nr:23S rRNA (uracil(1939)-C(5))-methyltransferase RlmD [Lachnospira sp.]